METPRVESCAGACWGAVIPGEFRRKALYVTPRPDRLSATLESWQNRFGPLGVKCEALPYFETRTINSGDDTSIISDVSDIITNSLRNVDVFLASPNTFLAMCKASASNSILQEILRDVKLVMLDSAQNLDDATEAAIGLLKMNGTVGEGIDDPIMQPICDPIDQPITTPDQIPIRFAVAASPIDKTSAVKLGAWLGVPKSMQSHAIKQFSGSNSHAVPNSLEVIGYHIPWAKSDFTFDRALDDKISDVVTKKRGVDKNPVIVLCASRENVSRTATHLAKHAEECVLKNGQPHPYILDERHRVTLENAANRVTDTTLKQCIAQGIGIRASEVSKFDKDFVDALFENETLSVLVCVYTANGMGKQSGTCSSTVHPNPPNLPPHLRAPLVVVKGTRKYVGNSQFSEMDTDDAARAFSACGRVGVSREGKVVFMTRRDTVSTYAKLKAGGGESIESKLTVYAPEYLNQVIACGAVTSNASAVAFLQNTFAYFKDVGVATDPTVQRAVRSALGDLKQAGMFDHGTQIELAPTALGRVMDNTHARLSSMKLLAANPFPVTCAETLETLCALTDEFPFCDAIRQDEKKLLRVWNAGKGFEQRAVRFPVMQQGRARGSENDVHENKQGQQGTENTEPTNNNPKPQMAPKPPKPVVATAIRAPAEKLFVLAQVCLSEFGTVAMASAPERTKLDAQRFMNRAPQLAAGAFAVFSQKIKNPNTFAASFSALRLSKSLALGMWDDTALPARQFGVSSVLCDRLKSSGVTSLDDILGVTPLELDHKAGCASPFGERLLRSVNGLPMATALRVTVLEPTNPGETAFLVKVNVYCENATIAAARAVLQKCQADGQNLPTWHAQLLVGCLWKDTLLFSKTLARQKRANATDEPFSETISVPSECAPHVPGEKAVIVAALLFENCVGRDQITDVTYVVPRVPTLGALDSALRARLGAVTETVSSPYARTPEAQRTPPPMHNTHQVTTPLSVAPPQNLFDGVEGERLDLTGLTDSYDSLFDSPRVDLPGKKPRREELSCES